MELKIFVSGAFSSTLEDLAPEYEKSSGYKIASTFGASSGDSNDSIPKRLARNEAADVLILVGEELQKLIDAHKAVAGSKVDIAHAAIAVAVRSGVPKPDVSTEEGLKKALLDAKSIGYSESASGHYVKGELFEKLGIADQVKDKAHLVHGKSVGEIVAKGELELGFQQLAELMPVKGINVLGLLPEHLQSITTISAGIAASSTQQQAATDFIRFLAAPARVGVLKKNGLEPANG